MAGHPPLKILLVEDSEEDGLLLATHLKDGGLSIDLTRVEDGAALQAALSGSSWDILLTDFAFPTMDGFFVIAEARRLAPSLPCIVISGQMGEESAVEALRAGAKDFVSKFKLARLIPAIQRELAENQVRAGATEARTELKTAEARFRAMTGAALDGIVMMDAENKITFWNRSAERIFGYSEQEVLGANLHTLIAPERYHAAFQSGFADFQDRGQGGAVGKVTELHARRKDGTEFPVEISLSALKEGKSWLAVGVVRDITERRALEREQLENLQFLQTLIGTIPNPFYYENMEGRILGCNRAFERYLGFDTSGVIGQKVSELLAGAEEENPNPMEEDFLIRHDACDTSFRRKLPNGRNHFAMFRRAPFWDSDGRPAGYVATILDITHLKDTEEALRQNQALFSVIHRHVVDLIAIIDSQGRRLYTSPSYQFVLGYTETEMAAHSSTELLHPDDVPRVTKALQDLMAGQITQGLEYRLRHKDGRWLYFESTAAIIPNQDPGNVQALVVARNVTDRKEAEQTRVAMEFQLRQAQKLEAIGQLAAGIAHEINTPTQYIGDNAAFLRDSFDETFSAMGRLRDQLLEIRAMGGEAGEAAGQALDDLKATDLDYLGSEIPKAIQQSLDGIARISKIVKAMKDFSHPGGESKTLTDIHQAIESTITVSRNEWKYAATLETDFDPGMPPVPCFPGEFNQVILNLIVNAAHAIEAAKEGGDSEVLGRITVKTRARMEEVEISVSDNGTGIPELVQTRMFEPFYTTKPVGKGSGQGLAIAHAVIVEKHQGRIEVQSEVGKGTTFILHLPLTINGPVEEHP